MALPSESLLHGLPVGTGVQVGPLTLYQWQVGLAHCRLPGAELVSSSPHRDSRPQPGVRSGTGCREGNAEPRLMSLFREEVI